MFKVKYFLQYGQSLTWITYTYLLNIWNFIFILNHLHGILADFRMMLLFLNDLFKSHTIAFDNALQSTKRVFSLVNGEHRPHAPLNEY